jgi:CheY-like chemotaxis protein
VSADTSAVGEVIADEGKVKQILYNLLSNAIKFTPKGGCIRVDACQGSDGVVVSVEDTGVGIAPEDRERIFETFQQLDAGTGREHEGTGLGLTLTKQFVELHGGRIWVDGAVGEGSRFSFSLPHSAAADEADYTEVIGPLANVPAPDNPHGLILVVEDDLRSANLISLYLARGGYRTEVATNGREALEKARRLQPLAITLDVIIPELDGWEVLRELKLSDATREIPVVIVSVVDDERLGYALGADDYLVKPVDRRALLARLARYNSRVLPTDDCTPGGDLIGLLDNMAGQEPVSGAVTHVA